MATLRAFSRCCHRLGLIPCLLALSAHAAAVGGTPRFPTTIVPTEAECREINEKHSLRRRPVLGRVAEGEWVWNHERVFTGLRSDVLG